MLNGAGGDFGFTVGADDAASPVLNKFLDTLKASPARFAPFMSSLARMGGAFGGMMGMAGPLTSAVGGLAGALGPLAVAIGAVVLALMKFNEIATAAEATIQQSIDSFARYETGLKEVATIIRGTDSEMDKLGDTALRMSTTFGSTVQQQLKGTYQTASAGFANAADAATIMDTANRLAVAGVTDVGSSVTLLAAILNGYSKDAQEAADVSDALFVTVEKGVTTVPQLAQAFGKVVPSSAAAGAKLDETLAALAALTRGGLSTAESVTALARMFDFLTKKPPAAMKVMEEYGVDIDKLNIRQQGILPVMQELGKAFEGNEDALIKAVPQIRAFRAAVNLSGNQLETFAEILDDMGNRMGATERAFQTQAESLDFQRRRWASFMDSLKVQLGAVFAPVLSRVLDVLEKVIDVVNGMPKGLRQIVLGFVALALTLPVVVKHAGGLLWDVGKLIILGGLAVTMLTMFGPALLAVAAAIAPLVVGIGALYLAWKTNLYGIRDTVILVWDKVKLTFKAVSELIKGGGILSGPLAEELSKAENVGVLRYAGLLYSAWVRLKAAGEAAWEGIKAALDAVQPTLEVLFPNLADFVKVLISGGEASTDLEKKLPIEAFKDFGTAVGESLGDLIKFTVRAAFWTETKLIPVLKDVWQGLRTIWRVGSVVFNALRAVLSPVITALSLVAAGLERIVRLGKQVGEFLGGYIDLPQLVAPKGGGAPPQVGIGEGQHAMLASAQAAMMGAPAMPPQQAKATQQQFTILLQNTLDMDGDKVGEKMQKYVLDLANREMVPST